MTRTLGTRRILNQPAARTASLGSVLAAWVRTLDSLTAEVIIRLVERKPVRD